MNGPTRKMELLPTLAPVYGGGLIVAFLPEDYVLPENIRAFLIFKGSQQRQITEARVVTEDNAFHAVIPDHEPPEEVDVSVYIQLPSHKGNIIATERFTFYLDQTCYLARYLAASVHNLESLEDWDYIQGPNFSLEQEDFSTLDERLTSAFQHLILPINWNLLGDHADELIPRETLFHFAARLGLSTFVTLLLEKNGAQECLALRNRHNELAESIARSRGFDGLADLITDPHAHGVIRWESKEKIGPTTVLKQHSFGTISTSSQPYLDTWPPIEKEVEALLTNSAPPTTPLPYRYDMNSTWDETVGGSPTSRYYGESYDSEVASPDNIFPHNYEYRQKLKDSRRAREESTSSNEVLAGNLKHLQELSEEIQYLRHKDIERLRHGDAQETARMSNSCPDLAQDMSYVGDETNDDIYRPGTPVMPRIRHALPPGIAEEFLDPQDAVQRDGIDALPPSPTALQRRHSWHSSESLPDEDVTSPGLQRRYSFQQDSNEELNKPDAIEEHVSPVMSPTVVRRAEKNNMAMFSVVGPSVVQDQGAVPKPICTDDMSLSRRTKSVCVNNSNNSGISSIPEPTDRRFTISEGLITDEQRSSMLALQAFINKQDEADDHEPVNSQRFHTESPQLSLSEFLSDPSNFDGKGNSQHPPPIPPKPGSKKMITRKLSFLEKMRSGARNKPKTKMKSTSEQMFGSSGRLTEEEDDTADATKDNNSSKNKSNKRPSIIQRPQSMMLNRPAQYAVGNPPTTAYAHPASRSNRPISTVGPQPRRNTGSNSSELSLPKDRSSSNRSSYHDDEEGTRTPPHTAYLNNMKDVISASFESLDEATLDTADLESDPDLALKPDEPEAWSVTMDKKVLKKMSKKEVKRQENIFELIQTERNYLTTLKIMQKIFMRGLVREAHCDQQTIEKLFPSIEEHVDYVSNFVGKLSDRQAEGKVVEGIGDVCVAHWSDTNGANMKQVLGDFCCNQSEIISVYKEMFKTDKKFNAFIKKCDKNPLTRRQGIPECALLVTQRVTKYPLMLQTLLDNSSKKEHEKDHADLEKALELAKEIAKDVDDQVQAHERKQILLEIHEKMEPKSTTQFKEGRKFTRKDLLKRKRRLLYSSNAVQWKISKEKKFTETLFVLLSDCFVLLQENNGKYTFPSGQPAVVPLMKLIVREVANDEKGMYLISMGNQQMYELKVDKADDCKTIMQVVRSAVGNCTEEDEEIPSEDEEERKIQEQRWDKTRRMIDQLEQKDEAINRLLKQKMDLFRTIAESVDKGSVISRMSFNYPTYYLPTEDESSNNNKNPLPAGTPVLLKAIEQVTKLSQALRGSRGLSRQPSSVGEESGPRSPSVLPKRSDTFGGFDNGKEPSSPRGNWLNSSQSDSKLVDQSNRLSITSESKRDSGLVDSDILVRRVDSQGSIHKEAWGENETPGSHSPSPTASNSGDSYITLPPEQILSISNLSDLLNSYLSISTQQDTHMEKMQQQLLLIQDKKKKGTNLQEVELRRNHIKQQEQLDELRKQQHQLKTERDQWQKTSERFQKSMSAEKEELEREKAKIQQEKMENDRQRDEIQRAKEEYQREMGRLRDIKRRTQHLDIHTSQSTSSLSSSSSATVNRNNSNNGPDLTELRLSTGDGKAVPMSKAHSSLHSSSTDLGSKAPPSPTYISASDYPRTFPGPKQASGAVSAPTAPQLPIHLKYSATNQLAALQAPRHQEFPSKLSKLASSTKGKPVSSSGDSKSSLMHQMIPSKLTKLASGQSGHHVSTASNKARSSQSKKQDSVAGGLQVPSHASNSRSPSPLFKNFTPNDDSKRSSQSDNAELFL